MDSLIEPDELIGALKKGREIRSLQHVGRAFARKNSACAIGAIALGLGFPNPTTLPKRGTPEYDSNTDPNNSVYDFLYEKIGTRLVNRLYMINDTSYPGTSDSNVIHYIEDEVTYTK